MGKKGKKAPTVDTGVSMAQLEKYTPTSYSSQFGDLGGVSSYYDPNTRRMVSSMQGSDITNKLSSAALQSLGGMEEATKAAGQQAFDANYAPAQRETSNTLNELMMQGGGANVRGNSRMQDIMARNADQLAESQGQRMYEIRNQGENNALAQLLQKYNMRMNPMQALMGQQGQLTNQLGTGIGNLASQGSSMLSNAAMANTQNKMSSQQGAAGGIGSLIGGGMNMIGSLFGKSDKRLKENIKQVGKLDNGLNVYVYNFKGNPKPEIGLIAQEVKMVNPSAVKTDDDGYLSVHYGKAAA